MVDATVNNVFLEVYKKPLNFNFDPETHKSEETAFKAWIYRIARYQLSDLIKESTNFSSMHVVGLENETYENHMVETTVELEQLSDNRKLLDKALSVLSERDKAILLTYFDFHEEGKKMPSNDLKLMCEYWGTTPDNARQIKKRSLQKVITQLEQLTQLKLSK